MTPATTTSPAQAPRVPNVHEAISHAMSLVHPVGKDGVNREQNYSFKRIDDFLDAANAAMSEAGVHMVPRVLTRLVDETHTTSNGKTVMRWVDLEVEFEIFGPSGDSVKALMWGEGRDAADKATNKALTAAQKYALMYLLMVPTSDIQDADRDSPEAGQAEHAGPSSGRPTVSPEIIAAQKTIIELGSERNLSRTGLVDEFARWNAAAGDDPSITIGTANLATLQLFIGDLRKPATPPVDAPAEQLAVTQ